jgi:glycosyltransferase involved in cell wall biosynthesis
MPPITALLHTKNDSLRLARALETLFPCAEILVIDHASGDGTRRIARAYGARIVTADAEAPAHQYFDGASNDWIFCVRPDESLSEGLQASLFEWAAQSHAGIGESAFSVMVRRQVGERWLEASTLQTRLISRRSSPCAALLGEKEYLPTHEPSAVVLEGELLQFDFP